MEEEDLDVILDGLHWGEWEFEKHTTDGGVQFDINGVTVVMYRKETE